MRTACIALAACAVAAGGASAQEAYVEEFEETYIETPAYVDTPVVEEVAPAADGIVVGSRVYGWVEERPADCGTFKYWDGDDCVDARYDPAYDE
jgi:hypothetical protein